MGDVRVLVVEDGLGLTQQLLLACSRRPSVRVLGPVVDADEARRAIEAAPVEVAVIDLDRADGAGLDLVRVVRAAAPSVRVLVAACEAGPHIAGRVLEAGASGILPPGGSAAALVDALERAAAGELVIPDAELASVVQLLRVGRPARSDAASISSLTRREREVLRLLADGHPTSDVALALGISPATVQSHVKSVLAKLGVHSKVEAVRIAWRSGAIAVPASA